MAESKLSVIIALLNVQQDQEKILLALQGLTANEWESLHESMLHQGLLPLIYAKLKPILEKISIPASIQDNLHKAYINTAYKNTLILNNVAALISALRSQNIDVIGLKGIYLAENIYENIAARPFGDIDILVRKEDIGTSISILDKLGYKMSTYFGVQDDNQDIKHVPPMINPDGLPVEIHWTLLEEDEPFTIDAQGLWDRAISAQNFWRICFGTLP